MNDEYMRFRTYQIIKRFLSVALVLYLLVLLNTPESLEALPDLKRCLDFDWSLFVYLIYH